MRSLEERLIWDSRSHLILQLLQKTNSYPSTMAEPEPVTTGHLAAAKGGSSSQDWGRNGTEHTEVPAELHRIPVTPSRQGPVQASSSEGTYRRLVLPGIGLKLIIKVMKQKNRISRSISLLMHICYWASTLCLELMVEAGAGACKLSASSSALCP